MKIAAKIFSRLTTYLVVGGSSHFCQNAALLLVENEIFNQIAKAQFTSQGPLPGTVVPVPVPTWRIQGSRTQERVPPVWSPEVSKVL